MPNQPNVNTYNIYVDNQNVKLSLEIANLLLVFAKLKGMVDRSKIYDFWPDKSPNSAKQKLESLGFQCLSVSSPIKDCADYQLVFDCIGDFDGNGWPDAIVLVSGDGDFQPFVNHLKKIGIKVIVFARKGNVKKTLMDSADEFHFIDELPGLIGIQNESDIQNISAVYEAVYEAVSDATNYEKSAVYITYDEAVSCLIEAINTALIQGKRTALSYINMLMRYNHRFPNYQGATSIQKPDGSNFAKFAEFIEAADRDGQVRLKKTSKIPAVVLREEKESEKSEAVSKSKHQKKSAGGITYYEAIQCLIEAIKTISSEGKCVDLSRLDRVMRSSGRFPNYQGVASIKKHKGKKFAKLSKFLEAAEKDRQVKLKKRKKRIQEVILIK